MQVRAISVHGELAPFKKAWLVSSYAQLGLHSRWRLSGDLPWEPERLLLAKAV
jgi:hypothetical protein